VDVQSLKLFNEFWRLRTPHETTAPPKAGDEVTGDKEDRVLGMRPQSARWMDINVPIERLALRLRLFESKGRTDQMVGQSVTKLVDLEAEGAAVPEGLERWFPLAAPPPLKSRRTEEQDKKAAIVAAFAATLPPRRDSFTGSRRVSVRPASPGGTVSEGGGGEAKDGEMLAAKMMARKMAKIRSQRAVENEPVAETATATPPPFSVKLRLAVRRPEHKVRRLKHYDVLAKPVTTPPTSPLAGEHLSM